MKKKGDQLITNSGMLSITKPIDVNIKISFLKKIFIRQSGAI